MSTSDRFQPPVVGVPLPIHLPAVERSILPNGLRVWTLPHTTLPVVALTVLVETGTADDPADLPGLGGITADLLDEGAGGRDAIHLAETLAGLGASMEVHAGPDATSVLIWTVARHLDAALRVLADVVARPHLDAADLTRVRDLRLSRLRQLRRSPASAAERVFAPAVYGAHGYGHPGLGTTASLSRVRINDVRAHYARQFAPSRVTVIAAGDIRHQALVEIAAGAFGAWQPAVTNVTKREMPLPPRASARLLFVERPGAPQSEIRTGHLAVPRVTPDYHALMLLNAGLGGSFSGRLNQRLRQQLGYTYGARSSFDTDRLAGTFVCETSVQGDKTADSVREIRDLIAGIRADAPLGGAELELARGVLTRGYARHFETPRQLVGALAELAIHGLPDDTFETFVPAIGRVDAAAVHTAARTRLDPARLVTVVVGDPQWRDGLGAIGIPVDTVVPEF